MNDAFEPNDDVIATVVEYWGRKTTIWRGTYIRWNNKESRHEIETAEGVQLFEPWVTIKKVSDE